MQTIKIFDTTLRDGEQSPGASLNTEEKIQLAIQLEKLGADVIEAGFPIASPDDFNAVRQIARKVQNSTVCALARGLDKDIDAAWNAIKDARNPRIHTFVSTSDIHIQHQIKKTRDEVKEMVRRAVNRAKGYTNDVEYTPMDASRSEMDFLCEVINIAISEGAVTINISDTVGYAIPSEWGKFINEIIERVPRFKDDVILSVHCHNDLGLAVANSIVAVENGARQVECTINGLGERGGNASLEEFVMALKVREKYLGKKTNINVKEIYPTSKMVASLTGICVQRNKAIVGLNAFAHESGIHQDGVLKNRENFEIMRAEDVGWESNVIVIGKHSGRHAISKHLEKLGIKLEDAQLEKFYDEFVKLADEKKEIFDEDLLVIANEITGNRLGRDISCYTLKKWHVETGSDGKPTASIILEKGGKLFEGKDSAPGPIDASYKVINTILGNQHELEHFGISALTRGKDSFGVVIVKLRDGNRLASGKGISLDIIEASINAYVDAVNKIERQADV